MLSTGLSFVLMGVAFLVTTFAYPHVLDFAVRHNVVDNPNARKLQRVPVPVMGGTSVMIGLTVACLICFFIVKDYRIIYFLLLLACMYGIGVWDDAKDVSAYFRFVVELFIVWMMIFFLDLEINDFHGLWGLHEIPDVVSVPISLIGGVGVINAINLIDGVDGYCSTYGMMACIVFALIFYYAGDTAMFIMALITIGALLPFFFHNVFGKSSKMFLGDGGSLMLGTMLTLFMFSTLCSHSPCADIDDEHLSLVALVLAILAVPVFDTLKVMGYRVARGLSPFHPDKTHLHHLFIELNYSHLATSLIIVTCNLFIIGFLMFGWFMGMSIDWQVYLVIILSIAFCWVFYFVMERQHRKNDGEGSPFFQRWTRHARKTSLTGTPFWILIRKAVDSRLLGGEVSFQAEEKTVEKQTPKKLDPRIE